MKLETKVVSLPNLWFRQKKQQLLIWLVCLVALSCFCPHQALAATYYVDGANLGGTCNDSSNGSSLSTAWCTVQKAATTAVAGDTVFIRANAYRESVVAANSGTAGSAILFQKYQNEVPIINGADLITSWTSLGGDESGGIFQTGFETGTFSDFSSTTADSGVTLAVQTSTVFRGTYADGATFNGVGRNAKANRNITPTNDTYTRMYFRINSSYALSAAATNQVIMNLRLDSSVNRMQVSLRRNVSNQFYLFAATQAPSTTTIYDGAGSAGQIQPDTWYYVEARYKGGDATTGGAELWLNGTSLGSNYGLNTTGLQVGRVEIGGSNSGTAVPSNGSSLYIDAVKVSATLNGAFTAAGNDNIYKSPGISATVRQVYENSAWMGAPQSSLAAVSGPNQWFFDTGNSTLYVWTSDSTSPSTKTLEASIRNTLFDLSSRGYITLDGLTVKYNNSNSNNLNGAGVFASGANNLILRNLIVSDNYGSGVYFKSTTASLITENSLLRNQRTFGGGIRFENGSNTNTISDNVITGLGTSGGNGIMLCGDATCNSMGNDGNTISGNTISNVQDSCIYLDTNNDTNTITETVCHDSYNDVSDPTRGGNGIHLALGSDSNIVQNNLVYNVERHGLSVRDGNSSNVLYNNTTHDTGTSTGNGIDIQGINTGTIVRNNTLVTAATSALNIDSGSADTVSNTNLLYNLGSSVGKWSGVTYNSLATYQAVSGQDANSFSEDPQFVNTGTSNFRLLATSVGIDSGTTIATVALDLDGVARPQGCGYDIGAYELTAATCSTPTPTPTAGTSTSSGGGSPGVTNNAVPRGCSEFPPHSSPYLFQIDRVDDTATLFFSPVGSPVDHYFISYGPFVGVMLYGTEMMGGSIGVHSLKISNLPLDQTLVFRVMGANGCAPGPWGNYLQARGGVRSRSFVYSASPQLPESQVPAGTASTTFEASPGTGFSPIRTTASPSPSPSVNTAGQPTSLSWHERLVDCVKGWFKRWPWTK